MPLELHRTADSVLVLLLRAVNASVASINPAERLDRQTIRTATVAVHPY